MSKWEDIDEVRALFAAIYSPLMAAGMPGTAETAVYKQMLGSFLARIETLFGDGGILAVMRPMLNQARLSGATMAQFKAIRTEAASQGLAGGAATLIAQRIVLLCLAQEARIIAEMTFRSTSDAGKVAEEMHREFDAAAEAASDGKDAAVYVAILSLHASVTKHLADIGRKLPRIIPYRFPASMPSLAMSQRVYQNGERSDELIAENSVRHPLFMPASGRMLTN